VTYDRHDDSGRFTPTFTPEDFLDALLVLDLPTTAEVAEQVGCAHRTALHHLNAMEDEGRVRSREAGRAKLWTFTDERHEEQGDTEEQDDVDALLDELRLRGERREAVRACFDHLRSRGCATRSDFTADVYPEHSVGFPSEESWWVGVVIRDFERLAERHDRISVPGKANDKWTFRLGNE
jgi:DNA-binding transcriptional regulator YhcF (GntR family)